MVTSTGGPYMSYWLYPWPSWAEVGTGRAPSRRARLATSQRRAMHEYRTLCRPSVKPIDLGRARWVGSEPPNDIPVPRARSPEALMAHETAGTTPAETFKPYVPDEVSLPEFTPRAVILGMLFGIIFGGVTGDGGARAGVAVP